MVECTIRRNPRQAAAPQGAADPLAPPMSPTSPTSPTSTVKDADTVFSRYSSNSLALTVVPPDLISKYESDFYYHGLSGSPPPLLWRSDLEESPFPVPAPGDRYFSIPVKTAHDAIGTPLAAVWPTAGPALHSASSLPGPLVARPQPARTRARRRSSGTSRLGASRRGGCRRTWTWTRTRTTRTRTTIPTTLTSVVHTALRQEYTSRGCLKENLMFYLSYP